MKECFSSPVSLLAGTPQGSVLSPLLYLIFVNDIPLGNNSRCRGGQFADDLSGWTSTKNKTRTHIYLQKTLNDIEDWCRQWRVNMNVKKTQLVRFIGGDVSTPVLRGVPQPLTFFGEILAQGKSLTLLGNIVDQKANMIQHCKARANMAMPRTNLMRLISGQKWGANTQTLLHVYKTLIRPVLEHGYVATADAPPAAIKILEVAERKALRIACKAPPRISNEDLYLVTGIRPLGERLRTLKESAINRFHNRTNCEEELCLALATII